MTALDGNLPTQAWNLETPFAVPAEASTDADLLEEDLDVEYEDLELERFEEERISTFGLKDDGQPIGFHDFTTLDSDIDLDEETEALLGGVRDAALGIWERTLVAAAIAKGNRDAAKLTNLVFFRRHPQRNNQPLRRAEPDFAGLAQEWNRIREMLVLPALAGAGPSGLRPGSPAGRAPGQSTVASKAPKQWSGRRRNPPFADTVYGLVVHQTGGKLPCDALARGESPVARAVEIYARSTGTHYVCGWAGRAAGELLQVADDFDKAHGVGMRKQRRSVVAGSWERDVSAPLVEGWRQRWPGRANPLELLPSGARDANDAFVHIEMIPVVVPWCQNGQGLPGQLPPPMRPGLRFTTAQHDAVADLAVDLGYRHGWPTGWWDTERLLGHEDLAPIERHSKSGGWDPGALRSHPYFDWEYVKQRIRRQIGA